MNKKGLIIICAIAAAAVLLFVITIIFQPAADERQPEQIVPLAADEQSDPPTDNTEPGANDDQSADPDSTQDQTGTDVSDPDTPTAKAPAEITTDELESTLFTEDESVERSFLEPAHQIELDDSSLSGKGKEQEKVKRFSVDWNETNDVQKHFPELAATAEKMMIVRPEQSLFTYVKELGKKLGLEGTTLRSSRENYSIFDTETGTYLLSYNILQNTYQSGHLNIPLGADDPQEGVLDFLTEKGLLGFAHEVEAIEDVNRGSTWISITHDFDLPVLFFKDRSSAPIGTSFKTPDGQQIYHPGYQGYTSVEVDDTNTIRQIYALAPQLESVGQVSMRNPAETIALFEKGEFGLGEALLAHPGAVDIKGRNEFFDIVGQSEITVENAEIYAIECGYLMEPESNLQVFLPPACVAHATGDIGGYEALFRVVVPMAVEQD